MPRFSAATHGFPTSGAVRLGLWLLRSHKTQVRLIPSLHCGAFMLLVCVKVVPFLICFVS
jgi:hypothetical protein